MVCLRHNKKVYLEKIIFQDCHMFDRTKTTFTEYFLKRPVENDSSNKPQNEELNTSRQLKESQPTDRGEDSDRRGTVDPLTLKDNLKDIENNIAAKDKTVEEVDKNDIGDDNEQVEDDIKIRSEFVHEDNTKPHEDINDSIKDDSEKVDPEKVQNQVTSAVCKSEVTMTDYESLNISEMFVYDKRSLKKYLWDNFVRHNLLMSILFKHSFVDPIYIRITKLVFCISLIFGTNAMLFSDYYIELRANSNYKVKNSLI
jgi:hypothetical protein